MSSLDDFLCNVESFKGGKGIFNPWADFNPELDICEHAPEIRLQHLRKYLTQRLHSADSILIAEAPGYLGARFSGLAMTSERQLLAGDASQQSLFDAPQNSFFEGKKQRTSRSDIIVNGHGNQSGMIEPTATIVWGALLELGINPYTVVLWNTFAWHPYKEEDQLSNRTPTDSEVKAGQETLESLLEVYKGRQVIAIGKIAQNTLKKMGITAPAVRHPANGGATEFRQQISMLVRPGFSEKKRIEGRVAA